MILVRFAAIPYSGSPGPISGILLLSGGYLVLAAFVVSLGSIGYQLSKYNAVSVVQAGAICAIAYVVIQHGLTAAILKIAFDTSLPLEAGLMAFVPMAVYATAAFALGVAGFLWSEKTRKSQF